MVHWGRKIFALILIASLAALLHGGAFAEESRKETVPSLQKSRVLEWRKERDYFFRTHPRSPLTPNEKARFTHLSYYPFDPEYVFSGPIERTLLPMNNPKYYATFVTNKGTNKRYVRYGKSLFKLKGKSYTIEVYKSLLSDSLFIPFTDGTNGQETYVGGRYVDAQIMPGYETILDFNMAYNPACAYNEKFVCALPPRENRLDIEIRAGEKIHPLLPLKSPPGESGDRSGSSP